MDWAKIAMAGPLGGMEWERQHKQEQEKNRLEYEIGTLPLGQSKQINNIMTVTHDPNGGFTLEGGHQEPKHFQSSYALIDYIMMHGSVHFMR
jgi:hypothetical protein